MKNSNGPWSLLLTKTTIFLTVTTQANKAMFDHSS